MDATDLLVVSDLHLGEDLGATSARTQRLEDALITFLDHHARDGRPWRLVVDGDMLDLVGAVVAPADAGILSGLHPDDHTYGLGGQALTATVKLRWILDRHRAVFAAFGRFLAAGKPISVVLGNHDAELHWDAAQELLRETLRVHALAAGASAEAAGDVTFHPWFYYEEGLAWIEHGHQYDPYCAFEEVLAPATDDVEIDPNLGALLPRYVGTRMLDPIHDLWGLGFVDYLRFWFRQGVDRIGGILFAYLDVFRRMAEHWRNRVPERVAARAARARVRLKRLSRLGLSEAHLHQLRAFAHRPIGEDLTRIVRALMLDRLALLLVGPLLPLLVFFLLPWSAQAVGQTLASGVLLGWLAFAMVSREPVDPSDAMRVAARRIRRLLGVPYVVMGHSHVPVEDADAHGTYFNTGAWVGSDAATAFTHLRIERTARGARARLCQWRDGRVVTYGADRPDTSVLVPGPAPSPAFGREARPTASPRHP